MPTLAVGMSNYCAEHGHEDVAMPPADWMSRKRTRLMLLRRQQLAERRIDQGGEFFGAAAKEETLVLGIGVCRGLFRQTA